ncbi:MAG: hypothetical protein ACK5LR_06180 [Mangrovibacterium sp.]
MNVSATKLGLISWIAQLNDTVVLEKLQQVHEENTPTSDWWDEISLADKQSIARGMKDFEEGRTYSHQQAAKIYEKYL